MITFGDYKGLSEGATVEELNAIANSMLDEIKSEINKKYPGVKGKHQFIYHPPDLILMPDYPFGIIACKVRLDVEQKVKTIPYMSADPLACVAGLESLKKKV